MKDDDCLKDIVLLNERILKMARRSMGDIHTDCTFLASHTDCTYLASMSLNFTEPVALRGLFQVHGRSVHVGLSAGEGPGW